MWVWIPLLLAPGIAVPALAWKIFDEVRRTISEDPHVWEKQIRAFERRDRKKAPPKHAIVFAGSSTIRLWTSLAKDMAPMPVVQRGFGGAKVNDVIHYADRVITPYEPRVVVLYIGSNDMLDALGNRPKSLQEMQHLYDVLLNRLHDRLPDAQVVMVATFASPANTRQRKEIASVNQHLSGVAAETSWLHFFDANDVLVRTDGRPNRSMFRFDRVHLNKKGYARWGRAVRQHVLDVWRTSGL